MLMRQFYFDRFPLAAMAAQQQSADATTHIVCVIGFVEMISVSRAPREHSVCAKMFGVSNMYIINRGMTGGACYYWWTWLYRMAKVDGENAGGKSRSKRETRHSSPNSYYIFKNPCNYRTSFALNEHCNEWWHYRCDCAPETAAFPSKL